MTDKEIEIYLEKLQEHVKILFLKQFPGEFGEDNYPRLSVRKGRKYTKIVSDNGVFGFIENRTGFLWKAAGFNSPAKNFSRGHINDDSGIKCAIWQGIQ